MKYARALAFVVIVLCLYLLVPVCHLILALIPEEDK